MKESYRENPASCSGLGPDAGDGDIAGVASAESAEERGPAKRHVEQDALHRTPSRNKRKSRGLLGVREAARKDSKLKFTALLHHIDVSSLRLAFFGLKKAAAVGNVSPSSA